MAGLEGLLTGRTLASRYRIEEMIGRGGFAVVYRAQDLRLGRPAAIKVITPLTADPQARERARERFQREARAAAGLPHHPNLVAIHDFGTDAETGIDFLAMELLRGEPLSAYLAREPRPALPLALAILRETAEGLAVGHRAGLIHRDVKPGNIFLAEAMEPGLPYRVCVLDFGIARMVDSDDPTLTRHDGVPLSPAYASPEQLRGERELTPASDVFSLGVLGYQLLTGSKPFGVDRDPEAPGLDVAAMLAAAPEVPATVASVIERATDPQPEIRHPDAAAFGEALDEAATLATELTGVPTVVEDRTVVYPAAPAPARRRRGAPAALLAIPVLGVVAAAVWALNPGGPRADSGRLGPAVADTEAVAPMQEPTGGPPVQVPGAARPAPVSTEPQPGPAGPAVTAPGNAPPPAPQPAEPRPQPPAQPLPAQPRPSEPKPPLPVDPPPAPQPQPEPPQPEPPAPRPPDTLRIPQLPPPAPRDTVRLPTVPVPT